MDGGSPFVFGLRASNFCFIQRKTSSLRQSRFEPMKKLGGPSPRVQSASNVRLETRSNSATSPAIMTSRT